MHVRFQNAAVFVESAPNQAAHREPTPRPKLPATTLWADRPFAIGQGKLVGVRRSGSVIEVALVASGEGRPKWLLADKVLNQTQVNRWLSSSSFR